MSRMGGRLGTGEGRSEALGRAMPPTHTCKESVEKCYRLPKSRSGSNLIGVDSYKDAHPVEEILQFL